MFIKVNMMIGSDSMEGEKEKKEKTSSLEKILEIIGINEPGKKLEKIFQVMNVTVKSGDVNQGSMDIQAMYDELQKALKNAGLSKVSDSTKNFLKGIASRIKLENLKSIIESLKIKNNVEKLDKVADILNLHARYQSAKENLEKMGVKNAGAKLKQMLEESIIQERVENFENYLASIGVEEPRRKIGELLETMGLKGAYDDIKALIGWDAAEPL
jgi:Ca2+-binding EF-hand superfamily protein